MVIIEYSVYKKIQTFQQKNIAIERSHQNLNCSDKTMFLV
jgi:hypothetical protein